MAQLKMQNANELRLQTSANSRDLDWPKMLNVSTVHLRKIYTTRCK